LTGLGVKYRLVEKGVFLPGYPHPALGPCPVLAKPAQ
jgi:hypothetical protein